MSQENVEIEKTVVIARPVDEVWQYIADARNDPQWCKKVLSVEQLTGDGPGLDASYRVVHRPVRLRKPNRLEVTVEEFDPPHRMRVREEVDDAVFNVTYELEPIGDATRLTQHDQIEWTILKLQRPIGNWMVGRDIENQFSALKRLLERSG